MLIDTLKIGGRKAMASHCVSNVEICCTIPRLWRNKAGLSAAYFGAETVIKAR